MCLPCQPGPAVLPGMLWRLFQPLRPEPEGQASHLRMAGASDTVCPDADTFARMQPTPGEIHYISCYKDSIICF